MYDMYKKLDNLEEIQKLEYIGYIWMSDLQEPKLVNNNKAFDFSEFNINTSIINPFIIEGNLFAANEKISVSIKHFNGNYFIFEVNLSKIDNIPENQFTGYEYLAHNALSNIKTLKFKQYWIEDNDPLCENMPVLIPAWRAFVGFEKGGEK